MGLGKKLKKLGKKIGKALVKNHLRNLAGSILGERFYSKYIKTKHKLVVNTGISRVVDDKSLMSIVDLGIEQYMTSEFNFTQDSIADRFKDNYMGSSPYKLQRMYNYAKADKYIFGLPQAENGFTDGEYLFNSLQEFYTKKFGSGVEMFYAYEGDSNNQHLAYMYLIQHFGYDAQLNILERIGSEFDDEICFLDDIKLIYCQHTYDNSDRSKLEPEGVAGTAGATYLRDWDYSRSHTQYEVNTSALYDTAEIYFVCLSDEDLTQYSGYVDRTVLSKEEFKTIKDRLVALMSKEELEELKQDLDETKTFYSYRFKKVINFLEYEYSGKPENASNENLGVGIPKIYKNYLSIAYKYHQDDTDIYNWDLYELGSNKEPEIDSIFTTSKAIGSFVPKLYFTLGGRNLVNEFKDKEPDNFKSMVQFAKRIGIDYEKFSKELLSSIELDDRSDLHQAYLTLGVPVYGHTDKLYNEYLYKFFERIFKSNKKNDEPYKYIISDKVYSQELGWKGMVKETIQGKVAQVGSYSSKLHLAERTAPTVFGRPLKNRGLEYLPYMAFNYQVSETEYIQYRVYELYTEEYVLGNLHNTLYADNENLLIPIDMSLLKELTFKEKEYLLMKSMHVVINTSTIIKKKWYQRGIFKAVMVIATIVISVFTAGVGTSFMAMVMAAVKGLVISLVAGVAIKYVVQLMIKLGLDVKWAAAIAVIAAIVFKNPQLFKNGLSSIVLTAKELLNYVNLAIKVSQEYIKQEMQSIAKEFEAFNLDKQKKLEELQQAQALLGKDFDSVPYAHLSQRRYATTMFVGETPTEFYNRTMQTNPGIAVYDLVYNFTEIGLQLPRNFIESSDEQGSEKWLMDMV